MALNNATISPNLTFTNGSSVAHSSLPPWVDYVVISILAVVMLVTIIGNGLVCLVIYWKPDMRTITGYFLFSLAISDLAVGFTCTPIAIAAFFNEEVLDNPTVCKFNGVSLVSFFLSSIITLTAISIHKCVTVTFPMRHYITRKRSIFILGLVWAIALTMGFSPVFGWSGYYHFKGKQQCTTRAPVNIAELIYMFLLLALGYLIPVPTMILCYTWIYLKTKRHIHRMKTKAVTDRNLSATESHITNTLVIVLVTFVACWLPFSVYTMFGFSHKKIPDVLPIIAFVFGYGNSAMNPIIYALRHESFRKGFRDILCFRGLSEGRMNVFSFSMQSGRRVKLSNYSNNYPGESPKLPHNSKVASLSAYTSLDTLDQSKDPELRYSQSSQCQVPVSSEVAVSSFSGSNTYEDNDDALSFNRQESNNSTKGLREQSPPRKRTSTKLGKELLQNWNVSVIKDFFSDEKDYGSELDKPTVALVGDETIDETAMESNGKITNAELRSSNIAVIDKSTSNESKRNGIEIKPIYV